MPRKIKPCKDLAVEYSKQMKKLERPFCNNTCGFVFFKNTFPVNLLEDKDYKKNSYLYFPLSI